MKKNILILSLLLQSIISFSQSNKATVYFTRASGLGALINFTFFDGEQVIGKFNGTKYMKYECEAGKHLFWARSENESYVEAELEANKMPLSFTKDELSEIQTEMAEKIKLGMDKYNNLKTSGEVIPVLTPAMTVTKEDFVYVKK